MPQDPQVQEVLLRTDLVDLIGSTVRLAKSGKSFKGLCPFHGEKTPSFHVYPNDGLRPGFFRCYGCQKSGDALTFLMEKEGLTFPEALDQLASKAGMQIERRRGPSKERHQNRLEILERCQSHYRSNLKHTEKGSKARTYLESRQLGEKLADRFGLGYALEGWDGLSRLFESDEVSMGVVKEQGLVRTSEKGGRPYDFFRDRLMFPIHGHSGQLVAFAGRDLSGESQAKYMNSSETDLFKKSRILYGFHQGKDAIRDRKRAILVEGYFDVIRMHEYGFAEAVAPMGTAVTEEQLRFLERFADELILLFDGDSAGQTAALRSLEQTWNLDLEVGVVHLPGGQDPDEFLLEQGAVRMNDLLLRATPGFRYLLDRTQAEHGMDKPEAIAKGVRQVFASLVRIQSALVVDLHLKELAEVYRVPLESLKRDWESFRKEHRQRQGPASLETQSKPVGEGRRARRTSTEEAERGLLTLLLMPEQTLQSAMGATFASSPRGREFLGQAMEILQKDQGETLLPPLIGTYLEKGPAAARLLWEEALEADPIRWEIEATLREEVFPDDPLRCLRDYIHTLRRAEIEKEIVDCREAILAAERSQEWDKLVEIAARVDALAKERDLILSETMEETG
jgi:DNA primase